MTRLKKIAVALILITATGTMVLSAETLDTHKLLKTIDEMKTFYNKDFSAVMTMITEDPEEGVDKRVVQQFRRDHDDKFLMLIREPEVQKGQGYLLIDENLWFYDPESRKFSHTSMKENFQNTDAKNSDFRKSSLVDDYEVTEYSEGKLGRYDVYILDLEAVHNEVTYPFMKIWVTKEPNLVLKAEEYSLTKRLMRTSFFPHYAKIGSVYTPDRIIFVDELVEGKKTQISIKDISLDDLPDTVFTKSYMERVNR